MNLDNYLADLANGIENYSKENQMQKGISSLYGKESINKIDEGLWPEYKYYIQQLCSKDYAFSNKKISSESFPLEDVLHRSFEICYDLTASLFSQGKEVEGKQIECLVLIYKMALISKKMVNAEYGFSSYLEKNIMIRNQTAFIDAICYHFLNLILSLLFKGEDLKWVYSVINTGISRLKIINIDYGYQEKHPIIVARTSWIDLLSVIKSKIEGTLLIESKEKVLKIKWEKYSDSLISIFLKPTPEIFLPHPKTKSIKDTKEFIDDYLSKKATESGNQWIKELLRNQPKNNTSNKTLRGYYPTVASFFKSAIKSRVIEETTTAAEFAKYLSAKYSNNLSLVNDLNDAITKMVTNEKYRIFDDMSRLFINFK